MMGTHVVKEVWCHQCTAHVEWTFEQGMTVGWCGSCSAELG